MKKLILVVVAVACGLLALVDYLVTEPSVDAAGAILTEGVIILAAFGLLAGVINLLSVHVHRAVYAERGRGASIVLIVALAVMLVARLLPNNTAAITWLFTYIYYPLQATMTALLAFFAVSAVYRAFRLRSLEAGILLATSLFMLLAQLPIGRELSPAIPQIRAWLMAVPVTAGMRGILIGVALGSMATALRVLLSVDRPYAGE
jgi:hypothetical protein